MKAARLHAYGTPLQIDEIPTPTPGAGQVVVAIRGAGFCHSDIHVIDGEIPILPRMPLVGLACPFTMVGTRSTYSFRPSDTWFRFGR